MAHKKGTGVITGSVAEDGVPKAFAALSLYDRDTGELVTRAQAGVAGEYVINGLNHETDSYYLVAQDDDGATRKNALVQDYIQPVNGVQGSSFDKNWLVYFKTLNLIRLVGGLPLTANDNTMPSWTFSNTSLGDITHGAALVTGSWAQSTQSTLLGDPTLLVTTITSGSVSLFPTTYYREVTNREKAGSSSQGITHEHSSLYIIDTSRPTQCLMATHPATGYSVQGINLTAAFAITVFMTTDSANNFDPVSYTIPSGAGRTGLHTFTVTTNTELGGTTKLYMDGVLVASSTHAQSFPIYDSNSALNYYGSGSMGGSTTSHQSSTPGNPSFVLVALFGKELSLAEVQRIHQLLYTQQPPTLTGYNKEVALDWPYFYNHLNCLNGQTTDDFFFGAQDETRKVFSPAINRLGTRGAKAGTAKNTPVAGGYGIRFDKTFLMESDGDYALYATAPVGPNRFSSSYEAWVRLESNPTGDSYIVGISHRNPSRVAQGVYVTASRTISVFNTSNVNDTVSFTPVLTVGGWYHVVVTINRVGGEAKLYLNGALVDTKSTGLTAITTTSNTVDVERKSGKIFVGGYKPASRVLTGLIDATIFGVAIYGQVLTAARVTAHYDARLVA